MKNFRAFATAVFFLLITLNAAAQRPYFVYLQTENQEPFFVQLNKKNHSSSSVGHVILSGLLNGTYTIQVGFTGQTSLQEYTFTVNGEDNGFVIKKFEGDAGYGIVNLQNATVQMSGAARKAQAEEERNKALAATEAQKIEAARIAEEDAMKAEQLKADSLKAATSVAIVAAPEVKNEIVEAEKPKTDSMNAIVPVAIVAATAVKKEGQEGEKAKAEIKDDARVEVKEKEEIIKKEDPKINTSLEVTGNAANAVVAAPAAVVLTAAEINRLQEEARRIDAQGKRDSVLNAQKSTAEKTTNPAFLDIDFTMPADSAAKVVEAYAADSISKKIAPVAAIEKSRDTTAPQKTTVEATQAVATPPVNTEEAVAVVGGVAAAKTVASAPVDSVRAAKSEEAIPAKNPNCNAEATDADIELVGMLMKGEKQPEDALDIARKTLKVKCVTTAQLRKIGLIFESQEDRYTLLDMAYRYTSDKDKYAGLSDLLTDPYFLNRFKAMLQ